MPPMWSLQRPDDQQLQRFLDVQAGQAFSYAEIGQSSEGAPAGYDRDHNRVLLGQGKPIFAAAWRAKIVGPFSYEVAGPSWRRRLFSACGSPHFMAAGPSFQSRGSTSP